MHTLLLELLCLQRQRFVTYVEQATTALIQTLVHPVRKGNTLHLGLEASIAILVSQAIIHTLHPELPFLQLHFFVPCVE